MLTSPYPFAFSETMKTDLEHLEGWATYQIECGTLAGPRAASAVFTAGPGPWMSTKQYEAIAQRTFELHPSLSDWWRSDETTRNCLHMHFATPETFSLGDALRAAHRYLSERWAMATKETGWQLDIPSLPGGAVQDETGMVAALVLALSIMKLELWPRWVRHRAIHMDPVRIPAGDLRVKPGFPAFDK